MAFFVLKCLINDVAFVFQYRVHNMLSVCLTIGAYSKWLDLSPNGLSTLPPLVDILMNGMSLSEDTAAAAALAFRHICDGKYIFRESITICPLLCSFSM